MKKLSYLVIGFFLIGSLAFGQTIHLEDKLPMDPQVKTGQLKNGLKYFIRKNVEPIDRAELRLVVKAGSILETDAQRGLAHFMEHMNFNGTKNFPKNDLVDFLQKSGIKFGADLNAYTSFDETVYMLPVLSNDLAQMEKFISVLADWSGRALLDKEEIDKERGVIMEELRLGKGAQQRMNEQRYPVLFKNSRYADRLPIGKQEVIQNAPQAEFQAFKTDWYRPNLEAVIAVGDFDPAAIEKIIQKQFSQFKNPKKPKERVKYEVPMVDREDVQIITDKEQPYTLVNAMYFHPQTKEITAQDRRNAIITALFNQMLGTRLSELTQKSNPPFLVGISNYGSFLAGLDAMNSIAVAKGLDVEGALIALLDENERARQFGFNESELDRAKLQYKTGVENQLAEKDKTASASYVSELVQGFINDVVMTNIEYDKAFVDQYLDGIKISEVNAFAKFALSSKNIVLTIMGPESAKDKFPAEARLKELLKNTGTQITQYEDQAVAASLVENIPAPGKITAERTFPEVGVTEITFANGINVYLKPTDFKNDEIFFTGNRWGGASLYADEDYDNASLASAVASQSGNGQLSNIELNKYLTGKSVGGNVTIGDISESLTFSSTVKDFETALQMMYNKFTNNHLDKEVVEGFLNNQKTFLQNMEATPTPEKMFSDTLTSVLTNYHFRGKPMTSQRFGEVNPERSMEIFKERFSDASGFNFTFVGNFDIEKIKPLLATYIGGLPTSGKKTEFVDRGVYPAKGKISKTVRKGTEDKASVNLIYTGNYQPTEMEELQLRALGEVLQIRLIESLREEEGGVYSPGARISTNRTPSPQFQARISFGCAPANVEKLIDISLKEIEKLKQNGASATDIGKFVSNAKLNYQTNLKSNSYWLSRISTQVKNGESLNSILDYEKELNAITPESTKATAQKYLTGENFIKAVLLPEN